MRRRIGYALIIVSVIVAAVACQPKAWWEEDYWWPDRFPGKPEGQDEVQVQDIVQSFETYGILQDVFNPDGVHMNVRWTNTDPVVYSRSGLMNDVKAALYATVSFNEYSGTGVVDKDFSIQSGEIVFEFKVDGDVSSSGTVNALSYTGHVTRDLIFRHEPTGSSYSVSDLSGISGGIVDEASKPELVVDVSDQLDVSLSIDSSISQFETDQDIIAVIDGSAVDTEASEADLEVLTGLVAEDEWLRLFVHPDADGYSTQITQDSEGYTGTIIFDGYSRDGWTIESGSISYRWENISYSGTTLIRVNEYTANISENTPLRFVSEDGKSDIRISATGLSGDCMLYANRKTGSAEPFDIWEWDSDLSGVLSIDGKEYSQTAPYVPSSLGELGIRGAGTESNPYKIDSEAQLRGLAKLVNSGTFDTSDKYFCLVDDIDLGNREWIPIGTVDGKTMIDYQGTKDSELSSIFKGHFDGNGHTISNLKITPGLIDSPYVSYSSSYQGLFGIVSAGASISNLTIDNVEIIGGGFLGAFVGFIPQTDSDEKAVLEKLHLTGDIEITGDSDIGGILGRCCYMTELEISDCSVDGNNGSYIRTPENLNSGATSFVGGIIGTAYSRGEGTKLSDCYVSNLDISAYVECVGGITGHFEMGTITDISVSDTDISLTGYSSTLAEDTAEAVGAVSGSVRGAVGAGNEPTTTQVTISGMEFENVTLNFPVHTDINLYGVVGRFRDNDRDNSKLHITVEGEGESIPEGITINNP